jgi:hypothetical protein
MRMATPRCMPIAKQPGADRWMLRGRHWNRPGSRATRYISRVTKDGRVVNPASYIAQSATSNQRTFLMWNE